MTFPVAVFPPELLDFPLEQLARIERSEPGKLASWLRAHPPLREPANNVYCISVVNLNRKGRTPCSKS